MMRQKKLLNAGMFLFPLCLLVLGAPSCATMEFTKVSGVPGTAAAFYAEKGFSLSEDQRLTPQGREAYEAECRRHQCSDPNLTRCKAEDGVPSGHKNGPGKPIWHWASEFETGQSPPRER